MVFKVDLNDGDKNQEGSSGTVSAKDRKLFDKHTGDFKEVDPDVIGDVEAQIPLSPDIDLSDFEEAETASPEEIIRAQEIINKANAIEQNDPFRDLRKTVDEAAINSLIATNGNQKDEFLRFKAMQLYNDMHKAAKLFLKDWCVIQHQRQKWSNPFKEQFRSTNEYIPKVYNLDIVSTIDQVTTRNLASMCLIARDACIEGAKKCGFDTSVHRGRILAKFPEEILNILFNDPRYLDEQRLMAIENEQRQQIAAMRFVRSDVKERWLRELTEKFKKGNSNKIV